MSVSSAAIVLGIAAGTVAAAPATKPSTAKKPAHAAKKKSAPKLSKWQQKIQDMLKKSAPGDEYYGRMKMSYLGINNTFRDDLIRAGAYTTDNHLMSGIGFADESLTDWAKKYPNDPQLARSYFLAFQMYRKIWTKEYQDKAWDYAHIVIKKWPNSFFGKTLAKDLQIGFTEHYFADPEPCPLPTATPSGSPAPATPMPSPSPTPIPTPSPTPEPGRPKAEILPAPCIAPATPSPSPTPLPTGSALPSPLPSGATPTPLPTGALTPTPLPSGAPTPSPRPTATRSPAASPLPSATPSPVATRRP